MNEQLLNKANLKNSKSELVSDLESQIFWLD